MSTSSHDKDKARRNNYCSDIAEEGLVDVWTTQAVITQRIHCITLHGACVLGQGCFLPVLAVPCKGVSTMVDKLLAQLQMARSSCQVQWSVLIFTGLIQAETS